MYSRMFEETLDFLDSWIFFTLPSSWFLKVELLNSSIFGILRFLELF